MNGNIFKIIGMFIKQNLPWIVGGIVSLILIFFGWGFWFSSNQLLFPSFNGVTKDLSACKEVTAKSWGKSCGNLRTTQEFEFSEIQIPSMNGYKLPGWLVKTADNKMEPVKSVIMYVHGGGSDRREATRYIPFFLKQELNVLTFDLGCHGEAPCPKPGLTYGHRESRDVLSAYLYLTKRYEKVYAMGASVGAASILIALPEMRELSGVIAENPMVSFQRLIKEAPESQSLPGWATDLLLNLAMTRAEFDGLLSPKNSLPLAENIPVYFIHSKKDNVVSYRQIQELVDIYQGPSKSWFPDQGKHAMIWNADSAGYEERIEDFLEIQ